MSASSDYLNVLSRLTEAKGAATAEAVRVNSNLWGSTIGNIGNMIAQYPEQQAKMKEIANRAALTQLERDRETRAAATEQRNTQGQQTANAVIAALPRNADGTYDTGALMQKLAAGGVPLEAQEKLATSIDNINKISSSYGQAKIDHAADLANSILTAHDPKEPVTWDAVHFGIAAAKPFGLASEQDQQSFADLEAQGADPEQVLKAVRNQSPKYKKSTEPIKLAKGEQLVDPNTYQPLASNTAETLPKTKEEILFDSLNDKSPTQAISQAAWKKQADEATAAIQTKPLTPYEKEELSRRDQELKLSQGRLAVAIKNSNKTAAAGASSDIVQAVIDHPELWGQLTPTTKANIAGALEKRGFTAFQKPPSATVENRLASATAVSQTGDDIIKQLRDPKVAAMVGPAMGRYNTLREFIGSPPPELSELAGSIESYALANMGVHGMRSVQGADEIKGLLDRKHTPESLIKTIEGLNKFSAHFMENEGRKVPTPSSGGSGLPAVGSTFQGGKVLKVTPVP